MSPQKEDVKEPVRPATLPLTVDGHRQVRDAEGRLIAITNDGFAADIVTACNAYPELLAALKALVAHVTDGTPYDANTTLANARAAIAKAESH